MRALAWLHAVPRPPEGSRRAKVGAPNLLSRLDRLKREGAVPAMPPNPAPGLIAWLIDLGIVQNGGMGPAPLSWSEIAAWQRLTAIDLDPWQGRLIRALSTAYIAEKGRAEEESCPPPWRAVATKQEVETEAARLRNLLG